MLGVSKPAAPTDDEKMPEGDMPSEGSPEDETEDKKWSIDMPPGFEPPDDAQEGDQFDITCRAHVEGDKLCIDSVNGIKTEEGAEEEGDSTDEATQPQSMDDAMSAHKNARPMGM